METIKTFGEFIKGGSFVIPDYQRAYSWGEKQLIPFINDILEHRDDNDNTSDDTRYYLGHYILEKAENSTEFEIVDGQQRISTVYLFLLVCEYLNEESYIKEIDFRPVSYDLDGLQEIKNILTKKNDVDIQLEQLLKISRTASLKRMVEAVILFIKSFFGSEKLKIEKLLNIDEISNYIEIINNAYCSVAVFNDKSVASQIFELHNTRGVKLTETEKVKALLMKNIYIHSSTPVEAENNIKEIQEDFARVFELEEKASNNWLRGELPLDMVLMYHLRAVEDGSKNDNFNSPQSFEGDRGSFEYIKNALSKKKKEEIVEYAKKISKEFAKSMEIITVDIPNADNENHLIGDVLLLDKHKSLIFLLRAFRSTNTVDYKLMERWENFVLCYDIIYWNGFFHRTQYRGNFDLIYASLKPGLDIEECKDLLSEYYKGKWFGSGWGHLGENTKKLFEQGKNKWFSSTYGWTRTGYLLYKYEIQNGGSLEKIRAQVFKDDKLSIDHIVARGLSWDNLGYPDYNELSEEVERRKEADKLWKEITEVINGIGNLALSTASHNSSDSNGLPNEHVTTFKKLGLEATTKQVVFWVNPKEFAFRINNRTNDILSFVSEKIINKSEIWE